MLRQTILLVAVLQSGILCPARADPLHPEMSWKSLDPREGITVEKGSTPGSPFHGFRGTGIVAADIGQVISVLFEHTRANEWVHALASSQQLGNDQRGVVVWQRFDSPRPIKDRDFIYLAQVDYDEEKQYFRAWFTDVSDTDIELANLEPPVVFDDSCCIVGKLIFTEWQFRATDQGSTCVRVEVMLDPNGRVPALFVNRFQRQWPYLTIQGLRQQVVKTDVSRHELFGTWKADREGMVISRNECEQGQLAISSTSE